jgi:hypothetical protein
MEIHDGSSFRKETVLIGTLLWDRAISFKDGINVAALLLFYSAHSVLVCLRVTTRSNRTISLVTTRVARWRAGYLYGAFAGAILVAHFWGRIGAVALGLFLFLAGHFGGNQIGTLVWTRIRPDTLLGA